LIPLHLLAKEIPERENGRHTGGTHHDHHQKDGEEGKSGSKFQLTKYLKNRHPGECRDPLPNSHSKYKPKTWIPAFAGMTDVIEYFRQKFNVPLQVCPIGRIAAIRYFIFELQ
jgi:hypothetical protein